MILKALAGYYERLVADPHVDIATEGYAEQRVGFALLLSPAGGLLRVQDLREPDRKKLAGKTLLLPTYEAAAKRTGNVAPFPLWDKSAYVLGADDESKLKTADAKQKRRKRNRETFEAFRAFQHELCDGIGDAGAQAVLRFLDAWPADPVPDLANWNDVAGTNLVFRLDGDDRFVHERPDLRAVWSRWQQQQSLTKQGFCLVSGERRPIARLHPDIKGVTGAPVAKLSTFNLEAFKSYGKEQNFNAPVSVEAAFAYTTALNHLLRWDSRQRIQIGDATTVFWAERPSPAEDLMASLFGGARAEGDGDGAEDRALVQQTRAVLEAVRQGRHPPELGDPEVPFYILGLGPNPPSRLVVRFWHVGTVGELASNLGRHFADLELERQFNSEPEFPSLWRLLIQLVPQRAGQKARSDDIPRPLSAALMRTLLTGADYPAGLYSSVLGRLRADHSVSYSRVALLKACLARRARKSNQPTEVTLSLIEQCTAPGYLIGRLFAVMEKAQRDALGSEINATIKDRFYGSAAATPGVVFPFLLAKAQHHISKAEYGGIDDRLIGSIMERIEVAQGGAGFPPHLDSTQQGLFALGYYHQRNAFFRPRDGGRPPEPEAPRADA